MVDEPADGVVLVGILEPEVRVEQLGEVVDVGTAVDAGLVVGEPHDERLLLVVLVLDLADDLLEEVLDGHQAGRPAVLVEDDREVDLPPLELVEQVVHAHRLGHEDRRAQDRAKGRPLGGGTLEERQQVLGVQDPDDLVDRLLVDRDPAVALIDERVDRLLERRTRRQRDHRDARDHDLVDALVAELDDRLDHLLLLGLEDPLLATTLDEE